MNLRHKTSSEARTQGQPWYTQSETIVEAPSQQETVPSQQEHQHQPRYEPGAAERILARAGALQEVHGQLLSREQIEAVAAEIGIRAEFVQRAIEQEKAGVLPEPRLAAKHETAATMEPMTLRTRMRITAASSGAIIAYGIFATLLLGRFSHSGPEFAKVVSVIFVLPALLAFAFGVTARSRRWGAAAGVVLALAVMAAIVTSFGGSFWGTVSRLTAWDVQAIAVMTGSGAILGAAGAQARRIVKRRQTSNRNGRTGVS